MLEEAFKLFLFPLDCESYLLGKLCNTDLLVADVGGKDTVLLRAVITKATNRGDGFNGILLKRDFESGFGTVP
ncbi:hypothetical protein E3E23_01670 [Thermococcus sp. CX2]|uniref:hypothetical protein n=1 Tax=Thermococcus sp. CX2 TaxID=163006 RepID=UPI00143A0FFF|nr:hypothetical protein [Thermococcus sp. CX2]NJE84554.1 hypothetical protein [Thermococcus sp. CX2]